MAVDALIRGLPANIDAEKFLLGSVLLDDSVMHDIRALMTADDFAIEKHRLIWRHMSALYDRGDHVDRITLANALVERNELDAVDGLSYLVSLDDGLPKIPNLDGYIKIIRDKAVLRRLIAAAERIQKRCFLSEGTPQEILDSVGKELLDLSPQEAGGGLQSVKELVDEVGINQLLAPRKERGLMFPWSWMNEATCGLLPGELWILAGHTSTGKTSAAMQFATNVARKGTGVAVFSLEVGKPSLFTKSVYQIARVDTEKAKRGILDNDEKRAVQKSASELYDLPLYFDTTSTTVTAIHAAIRRRKLSGPIGLIVVDYL